MDCLIIAAGYGSRLRAVCDSKPLTPVAGMPLIEHVIRRALEGGASRFTVVTGHQADRVEAFLQELGDRLAVAIAAVRLDDWSRPNGWSMAAGAAAIPGEFLLMMADHIVDPGIVRGLVGHPRADNELLLAVDYRITNALLDLEDATRVQVGPDRAIVRIDKLIEPFDAVDTGVFLTGKALVRAHESVVASGGAGSLSQAVQHLADRGLARAVDIGDLWWQDVDDADSLGLAEASLELGASLLRSPVRM